MNAGLIVLIIFTICITVGMIVLLVYAGIDFSKSQSLASTTTVLAPTCADSTNISTLLQIPSTTAPCVQNGLTTSLYYIGALANGKYNFVVAPWPTAPLDVCVAYCTQYLNGTCTGSVYNGQSAQANFTACLQQLNALPTNQCTPPAPIAAIGTTLYYPYSPTNLVCT